jgi:iron(III) transport system permease protein
VLLSLVVMIGESSVRGAGHVSRGGPGVQRVLTRRSLGGTKWPVVLCFVVLVGAALGVPVGSSIYWMFEGGAHAIGGVSLTSAALYTAGFSAAAALVATLMALPVALLVVRHPTKLHRFLTRTTFLVLAMPGLVVALALSYFSEQHANGFGYETAPLLIFAYALMFFPLALVGVRASVAQAPVALEEVAGSLGVKRRHVLLRVTLPLVAPGLGAAFCLVFLSAVTELTATLILIPSGVQTLATQFWSYQQNLSYGQAAPFALLIIAIAALPAYLVGRFFDRLPVRQGPSPVRRVLK